MLFRSGFIAHKIERYEQYRAALDGALGMRILPFRGGVRSNHWFYSLYLEGCRTGREEMMLALREKQIQTRPVWGLIHRQGPYIGCAAYATEKAER